MASLKLRNEILSAFKLNGLSLKSDARSYLMELLQPLEDSDRDDWLEKIVDEVQKQGLASPLIDKSLLQKVTKECTLKEEEEEANLLRTINAFTVPKFTYLQERKKFTNDATLGKKSPSLFGCANDKAEVYRNRYILLQQRTLRHELFTATASTPGSLGADSRKFHLRPVEFLLGTSAKVSEVIVLGMITQLKEGRYHLEDPTGSVELDMKETKFHTGLFTENSFVLAEGWYEDRIFHVTAMGFPPPEAAKTTRAFFGNVNFFGGPGEQSVKGSIKLKELEQRNPDSMIVFLSDVHLDSIKVMKKLETLFRGYSFMPPTAFVLMGNFSSALLQGASQVQSLKTHFKALGELIAQYPNLVKSSKFILIPGPGDPASPNILPRPPLPNFITNEFCRLVPGSVFGSNPTRITYGTKEVVVFREDIVTKMCRNAIYFPTHTDNITMHVYKSITSQAHLAPLPTHVCPTYWGWDHALYLYPLPDLIVLADRFQPFSVSQMDCNLVNPGSFSKNDFSFKVYYPFRNQVEDSQISDTTD